MPDTAVSVPVAVTPGRKVRTVNMHQALLKFAVLSAVALVTMTQPAPAPDSYRPRQLVADARLWEKVDAPTPWEAKLVCRDPRCGRIGAEMHAGTITFHNIPDPLRGTTKGKPADFWLNRALSSFVPPGYMLRENTDYSRIFQVTERMYNCRIMLPFYQHRASQDQGPRPVRVLHVSRYWQLGDYQFSIIATDHVLNEGAVLSEDVQMPPGLVMETKRTGGMAPFLMWRKGVELRSLDDEVIALRARDEVCP